MRILIVGVSGFIGRHLYRALSQQGHYLIGCSRHKVADINWQGFSFEQSIQDWHKQLQHIDIVINAAGIYQQSQSQRFAQIHDHGPKRLFTACTQNNIRVLQISAIGAEQEVPVSDFLQSKRNADQYLLKQAQALAQKYAHVVLYPGIVLGEKGKSTRQLCTLAQSYCIPLVFGKQIELPLLSIYQLSDFVVNLLKHWPKNNQSVCLLAKAESMEHLLNQLRHWLNFSSAYFIYIPGQITQAMFYCLPKLSIGVFNKQSIEMLTVYSHKSIPAAIVTPIMNETASDSLLKNTASSDFKRSLRHNILFYINIFVLSLIWIMSGMSSLVNIEQSRELIALIGVQGQWADVLIISAAIGDILLGLLIWAGSTMRRWILYMQLGVMLIYSIILTLFMPIFWLHPFAPIIKNLALLVLVLYLLNEEQN